MELPDVSEDMTPKEESELREWHDVMDDRILHALDKQSPLDHPRDSEK